MTDEQCAKKWGPWVDTIRDALAKSVAPDGFVCPVDASPDVVDAILSIHFGDKPGPVTDDRICWTGVPSRLEHV